MGCVSSMKSDPSSQTRNFNKQNRDPIQKLHIQNENFQDISQSITLTETFTMLSSENQSDLPKSNNSAPGDGEINDYEKGMTLSKKNSGFKWQDVDLTSLLSNLNLEDGSTYWWDVVDKLRVKERPIIRAETERKGWKTVRLFVSSTFKDMWAEREYLAKRVFPELREWCEMRKLRLVECDLRWGVPKDADTNQTLSACLSEIDRCKEDNGIPYLLTLLGERYGWVPDAEVVPDDIKSRYKWIPGMSVTSLEIFTGGYWDRNPKALYLLRSPEILKQIKDSTERALFEEEDIRSQESLKILKGKLLENYREQVKEYNCDLEKVEDTKMHLSGLEEFGRVVLDHFKTHIDYQYPADSLGKEISIAEIQRGEHETFMIQRSEVLLGRDKIISSIKDYLKTDATKSVPLALIGSAGAGKSALVAYTAKYCTQQADYKTFYHFVGATSLSTDLYLVLARFFMEFLPAQEKMPENIEDMIRFTPTMIQKAWEFAKDDGFKKIVILIDALNQMDDESDAHSLIWLPRVLPAGVRIIVSTLEGKCLNSLREHPVGNLEIVVEPLGLGIRKMIAKSILEDYSKKLDEEQMEILVNKEDAGRPLWLTVACEELRVFGEFRKLTQKTRDLPDDLPGLLKVVMQRIVNEYGKDLVMSTLCLIETSRFGLTEPELLELLAIHPPLPTNGMAHSIVMAENTKLPMAQWALVYLGLKKFLRPCGSFGGGKLDFYHRTISKVVREVYLNDKSTRNWWHQRLAKYFDNCTDIERKAEELPYHLECSQDRDGLKAALLEWDMFDQLYCESSKPLLMKFWRFVGGYDVAADEYIKQLKSYTTRGDTGQIESMQIRVGWFLVDIGEYDKARQLLEDVLETIESDSEKKKLLEQKAKVLYGIVMLLYRKALQYVYGNNPGYIECRNLGQRYATLCFQLHTENWPKMDNYLGHVVTVCGYFVPEALEEAREIFQHTGDKQGLAQVLYMMGEREQYNSDLSIPTKLFSHSAVLCMSSFGKFNLHTARCYQLFGQMYWNNTLGRRRQDVPADAMARCLDLYKKELEILEEVLGPIHPTCIRSREDVIIILQNLGRNEESEELQKQQPAEHSAVAN
ncbi:hypothetical protein ScPMuIL_011773 [Solemya velum]